MVLESRVLPLSHWNFAESVAKRDVVVVVVVVAAVVVVVADVVPKISSSFVLELTLASGRSAP